MKRHVSNKRKRCHVTVLVDGTEQEYEFILQQIRRMERKKAHSFEEGMSYDVVFIPQRKIEPGRDQGNLQEFRFLSQGK